MTSQPQRSAVRLTSAGYSLIEMVTVISLMGVVMLACALMIHTLLKVEQVTRRDELLSLTVNEVVHRFRHDVHRAELGTLSPDMRELSLSLGQGHVVVYQLEEQKITVREEIGDEVARREVYQLPGCQMSWESQVRPAGWKLQLKRPAVSLTTKNLPEEREIHFDIFALTSRYRDSQAIRVTAAREPQ